MSIMKWTVLMLSLHSDSPTAQHQKANDFLKRWSRLCDDDQLSIWLLNEKIKRLDAVNYLSMLTHTMMWKNFHRKTLAVHYLHAFSIDEFNVLASKNLEVKALNTSEMTHIYKSARKILIGDKFYLDILEILIHQRPVARNTGAVWELASPVELVSRLNDPGEKDWKYT